MGSWIHLTLKTKLKNAQLAESEAPETLQTMDDVLSKIVSSDMGLEQLESEILKKAVDEAKGIYQKLRACSASPARNWPID